MYPGERALVKELSGRPFAIVGVNSDTDREALKQTLIEKDLTWRSFWDGGSTFGPIAARWNVRGWPTVYLIDAKGTIRLRGMDGFRETLSKLLAEAEGT